MKASDNGMFRPRGESLLGTVGGGSRGNPESLGVKSFSPPASRVAGKPEQIKRGVSARLLPRRAVHFVGFKGEEYTRAQRVFGPPDLVHRHYDARMLGDVAPNDLVVFARGAETRFHRFSFNDSEWF